MKAYKFIFILILIPGLIAIIHGCKKDTIHKADIIGTWVASAYYNDAWVFKKTYRFSADSSVQVTNTINDKTSGKLLGYQFLVNGKFRLNGEHLKLFRLGALYINRSDTASFVPLEKLVPFPSDTLETYTIKISYANSLFYFYYPPCPANANCAATLIYKRE